MITRWWISPGGQIRLRSVTQGTASEENSFVITIDVGERLDFSSNDLIHKACEFTWYYQANRIIVNLANTSRLHDSGLAMLLVLRKKAANSVLAIDIANSTAAVKTALDRIALPQPISIL